MFPIASPPRGYGRGAPRELEAVLVQGTNNLPEAVPLLADLLSIPTGDRYPTLNVTPQERKEKTLQALLTQVAGLARQQPVLTVFEDVHWSDPTTREVLDLLITASPRSNHFPAGVYPALDRAVANDPAQRQSIAASTARRDDRPKLCPRRSPTRSMLAHPLGRGS